MKIKTLKKTLPSIIFGAGSAARDWIFSNRNSNIIFFVDNDETKWGNKFFNFEVKSPDTLKQYVGKANVLIMSVYVKEIKSQLEKLGFKWGENLFANVSSNFFVLKEKMTIEEFFRNLDLFGVQYVVLRNFSKLPSNVGGDVDLLVSDSDLDLLNKYGLIKASFSRESNIINDFKFDVYSVSGAQGFRFRNMAIYQPEKSKGILLRKKIKKLFYVPSKKDLKWSYLYYVCYFKNIESCYL